MALKGKHLWNVLLMLIDILIVCAAYTVVMYLLYKENGFIYTEGNAAAELTAYYWTIAAASVIYAAFAVSVGGYNNLWKYAGISEHAMLGASCAASCLIMILLSFFSKGMICTKIGVHFLSAFIIAVAFVGVRIIPRAFHIAAKKLTKAKNEEEIIRKKRLLIVGAGDAARKVVTDIMITDTRYDIVGMVDDDKSKIGQNVCGVRVLGNRHDIERICAEKNIDEILLAIPSLPEYEKKEMIDICSRTLRKVRILPSLSEIISFDNLRSSVRDIRIEDLLERDPIDIDNERISDIISNKKVLITGGGGSIGSELCRQIAKFSPKTLYVLDIYENNAYDLQNELKMSMPSLDLRVIIASVRDVDRLENIFENIHPDIIFHAAAHKHVPLMENNSSEAIKNNVIGTKNVAMCAHKYGVRRFVLISTDKAVNPTNVMGATKRVAEMIIQSLEKISKTEFVAVRFGNVLGSNGSVVPLFKRQIENGGPVTLTDKRITRFFMTIPEAAQLVLEAASYAHGGEIFVLDMGKPVKIYDLAVNMIRLSGHEPDVDIKIETIGLREGEKLYEEVLLEEEGIGQTCNEKIFVAKPMIFDWHELNEKIDRLYAAALNYDDRRIIEEIKNTVPTYHEPSCGGCDSVHEASEKSPAAVSR